MFLIAISQRQEMKRSMELTEWIVVSISMPKLVTSIHRYVDICISALKNAFTVDIRSTFSTELVRHDPHYEFGKNVIPVSYRRPRLRPTIRSLYHLSDSP